MATQASIEQVQRAYISYYNRPGDPGGVDYWATRLDNGETLSSIINAFANSVEAEALYDGVSTADLIVNVYQQAFGREPDAEGRDYWAGRIDSGDITPGQALLTIVEGASGNDLAIISNKVDFAIQVTNSFASDTEYNEGKSALSEIMAGITSDVATVAAALESLSDSQEPDNFLVGTWTATPDSIPDDGDDILEITFTEDGRFYLWESLGESEWEEADLVDWGGPSILAPGSAAPEGGSVDNPTGYYGLTEITYDGDEDGGYGEEIGTYSWDAETQILTIHEFTLDNNGDLGLSSIWDADPETDGIQLQVEIVGSGMYWDDPEAPGDNEGVSWSLV